MENPYLNLQPANNAGNALMDAFKQAQQTRREDATRNALAKYAQNPNDPEAMSEVTKWNPELGIKLKSHQQEMALKQLDAHKDQIQIGAAILQATKPHDQASWDAAKTEAARYGVDVSHLPPAWDATAQQYVQGVIAANQHLNPEKDSRPADVRSFEYRQALPPEQRAGYDQFVRNSRPQIFGSAESGYNVYDPNAAPTPAPQQAPNMAEMPTVSTPQQAMSLPPGTQFRLPDGRIGTVPGGAGGNASGNFPR